MLLSKKNFKKSYKIHIVNKIESFYILTKINLQFYQELQWIFDKALSLLRLII